MGILLFTVCKSSCFFKVTVLDAHGLSQAEELIPDNGEGLAHHPTMTGRIFRIVVTKSHHKYVIIEAFDVSGSRDSRYGMPTMYASPDCGYHIISSSVSYRPLWLRSPLIILQKILFIFNAQHDCEGGECGYTIDSTGTQNGQATAKVERKVIHSTHNKFFINLHALHNAWRLHEVLPRNLTEPVPYVPNRKEFHHKMARKLQKKNPQKRAKAKEKAKDTRCRVRRLKGCSQ